MKERDLKKGKKKKRKYITLKQLCKEIDELIALCKIRMEELKRPKRHPKKTCEPSIKHTRLIGFKHDQ
jgi:hypothetical protein